MSHGHAASHDQDPASEILAGHYFNSSYACEIACADLCAGDCMQGDKLQ